MEEKGFEEEKVKAQLEHEKIVFEQKMIEQEQALERQRQEMDEQVELAMRSQLDKEK